MGMFDFFKRKEAPKQEAQVEKSYVTEESPEQVRDRANTNREITVNAIAENLFNSGMVKGGESGEEKRQKAQEMAQEAVAMLSPEQRQIMETMDTSELRGNTGALVGEAVALYNERQDAVAASMEADEAAADDAKKAAEQEAV